MDKVQLGKSNKAVIVFVISLGLALVMTFFSQGPDPVTQKLVLVLGWVAALALGTGAWFYSKAKGYSGFVGLALIILLNLIGYIILVLVLPNRNKAKVIESVEAKE